MGALSWKTSQLSLLNKDQLLQEKELAPSGANSDLLEQTHFRNDIFYQAG